MGHRAVRDELVQLGPGRLGDIQERPQRAWHEERVARSPQHARAAPDGERPEEARFADAGLAGDEQQLTGAAAAVTDDGVLEFYVDCDGAAGAVFTDDWTASAA